MPWTALGSVAAAGINAWQSNQNTDKSIAAQQEENRKNREYNLKLAQMQNQWNLEQWQRENEYNSPSAQMARMRAAGLNPDMMYGGGVSGNLAASSPDMTAGSPAIAQDFTALASKKTLGSALMESLALEQANANINKTKAETQKTLADAGLSQISLEYADMEKKLGLKMTEAEYEKVKQDLEIGKQTIEKNIISIENYSLDTVHKQLRNHYDSVVWENTTKKLAAELKITESQAKNAERYYIAQMLNLEADAAWKDAAWIIQQKGGTASLIKYGTEALGDFLPALTSLIGKRKKGGLTINNNVN